MRLIDADALIESICQKECERHYSDCDYDCSSVVPVINAPTIEAVPIKPLAKWLAGYAAAPAFHLQMVCHVEPRGNVLDANAKCWERLLRRMDWEGADE